jgi:hypothetical protein
MSNSDVIELYNQLEGTEIVQIYKWDLFI